MLPSLSAAAPATGLDGSQHHGQSTHASEPSAASPTKAAGQSTLQKRIHDANVLAHGSCSASTPHLPGHLRSAAALSSVRRRRIRGRRALAAPAHHSALPCRRSEQSSGTRSPRTAAPPRSGRRCTPRATPPTSRDCFSTSTPQRSRWQSPILRHFTTRAGSSMRCHRGQWRTLRTGRISDSGCAIGPRGAAHGGLP